LLDALGTLVELESPVEPLRRELRERFGVEVGEAAAGAALRAEIAFYRAHHDEASDRAQLARLRRRAAAALRDALPPDVAARLPAPLDGGPPHRDDDEPELDPLTQALLAALRFRPFPEVAEVLRGVRERGVRLVVVSNWDVSLHDVLREAGLAPLLDGVVTSAELGSAKPAPAIFARALALAGVAADQAVHVGDSVEHDVAGAQAAGIEPLLLVRSGSAPDGPAPPGVGTIATLRPLLRIV
jgi:putative hydrolase of the HAD superfamily